MTYTDAILNANVVTVQYSDGFYANVDVSRGTDPTVKPQPDTKEPDVKPTDAAMPSTSVQTFVQQNGQMDYLMVAMLMMTLMIVMVAIAVVKK